MSRRQPCCDGNPAAEGWFNLALLAEAESRPREAIAHDRKALELDPAFVPARVNLRQLEAAAGRGR